MPGCCVIGCSNSDSKGFLMKRFPSDPKRRKEWEIKVKRKNWKPTNTTFLCEVHFTPDMFEQHRADLKRRLKPNAVPTIFPHIPPKKVRKPPAVRRSPLKKKRVLEEQEPCTSQTIQDADEPSSTGRTEKTYEDSPISTSTSSSLAPSTPLHSRMKRKDLKEWLQAYNKAYTKVVRRNMILKNRLRKTKRDIKGVEQNNYLKCLTKVFSANQIKALMTYNVRSKPKWDDETIKRGLKLKFACGNAGYDELLKQNLPLPSHRTLRRRVQDISFKPGIQDQVFQFFKIKIEHFSDEKEKDCCLVLDEMSIMPGKLYDTAINGYLGFVSLGNGKTNPSILATHAIVFMLGGINSRWKQTIAYHFTGDSVRGDRLSEIINEILIKSKEIGLNVISITSDMGSSNQSFWKTHNIIAGRFSQIKNYFLHPSDTNLKVYIIADPVHLFKNIRSTFLNNKVIEIPQDTLDKNHLSYKFASSSHLNDLVQFQDQLKFKLAPKLHEEDLTPSHFQSMKVSSASHIISHSVSSGLKYLAQELNNPEYLTTAWFLDQIEKWFKLMSSRHPVFALSKINYDAYRNALTFLEDFVKMFKEIKIGLKAAWKPCQKGVLISTTSILEIQQFLLDDKKYQFVLTGRFTQDCLENLFSLVRAKQPVPNALQFKSNLKLIMLSQYLRDTSKGSYEKDEREEFSDFLKLIKEKKTTEEPEHLPKVLLIKEISLNRAEKNVLYSICGYIITSIKKNNKVCDTCIASLGGYSPFNLEYEKLTLLKSFKDNTLFFCNEETFNFVLKLENIFSSCISYIETYKASIKNFILEKMQTVEGGHILNCHYIRDTFVKRYLTFRLKINSSKKKCSTCSVFSSKSMNMYARQLV